MIGRRVFRLRSLRRDSTGATLVEFAFVAPVLVLMLMGLFEFGFQVYARSVLQGAVQEAARDATLEGGEINVSALDTSVREQIQNVIPSAVVTFERTNYSNFSDVRQPEEFTDNNGDGDCNNNEPFEDLNDNGTWDEDRGQDGLGGARDAVLYEATARFDRVFPLHQMMGWDKQVSIDASTVLRNQPFETQEVRTPVVGNCD